MANEISSNTLYRGVAPEKVLAPKKCFLVGRFSTLPRNESTYQNNDFFSKKKTFVADRHVEKIIFPRPHTDTQ